MKTVNLGCDVEDDLKQLIINESMSKVHPAVENIIRKLEIRKEILESAKRKSLVSINIKEEKKRHKIISSQYRK